MYHRVQAYIRNGWSGNIVDPDHGSDTTGEASLSSEFDIESGTWKPLKEAFSATSQPPFSFSNAEIINYFMMRKAVDGLPASNMFYFNLGISILHFNL